jgi:hypothetical protein
VASYDNSCAGKQAAKEQAATGQEQRINRGMEQVAPEVLLARALANDLRDGAGSRAAFAVGRSEG